MSFQKHTCIRVFAIAFVLDSAATMRVQPARLAAKKETTGVQDERPIDVTSLLDTAAFKKSGYDCCCDKRKPGEAGRADDERGIDNATRANYCKIAYTWLRPSKCGGIKVAVDTVMAHNYKKTGGTCEIMRDNVPTLVEALGKPDYCPEKEYGFRYKEGKNIYVNIPSAAFKKTARAPCLDGGYSGKVTCQVGTPTVGYWSAVECGGKPKWCPATVKSSDGSPGLSAKMLDEEQDVICEETKASTDSTKCTARGWIPKVVLPDGSTRWDADGFPPVCLKTG